MKTCLLLLILFVLSIQNKAQTVTDIEGNIYNTVTIGTQVWMKENLKTTKYNDETSIPNETNETNWKTLTTPSYCWYVNDSNKYKVTYGALYNWYTINSGKLCPIGWHSPTNSDWTILTTYLGGESVAGGKLKETGNTHWYSPNYGATDESSFTALPGGFRNEFGSFQYLSSGGYWWSATEYNDSNALSRIILYRDCTVNVNYNGNDKRMGFSVRCLRDNTSSVSKTNVDETEIYPNPSKDMLYFENINLINSVVNIFNLKGEMILYKQNNLNSVYISNLKNGVYIVKIIDSGKIKIYKFIKD
jgi:uncharacterized protein (TIGR02145 family)